MAVFPKIWLETLGFGIHVLITNVSYRVLHFNLYLVLTAFNKSSNCLSGECPHIRLGSDLKSTRSICKKLSKHQATFQFE